MTTAGASSASKLDRIPALLYGTAWKGEATTALVLQAIAAGFRGVDVAGQRKHYREDLVGDAIARAESAFGMGREHFWLQSKFTPTSGQDLTGPVPYKLDAPPRQAVRQSFESSLRNLHKGTDWAHDTGAASGKRPWLDSYLLHSPLKTLEETLEAWSAMEDLVQEGRVRLIGFSNVYDARIFEALRRSAKKVQPRIVQNRWHHTSGHDVSLLSSFSPALSPNDFTGAVSDAASTGIVYQPFWTLTGNPRLLSTVEVATAAERHEWTSAQTVYRFVVQGFGIPGLQCVVLCGTTDEQHMREAVHAVLGSDALDGKEMEAIRKVIYGE